MDQFILYEPEKEAILLANQDLDYHLFEYLITYQSALEQHQNLQKILKSKGYKLIKLNSYIPKYIDKKEYTNFLFTRDSFIETKRGLIIGCMKENARIKECELMEKLLARFGKQSVYKMESPEVLEGGDFVTYGDTAFIAVGVRTNELGFNKLIEYDLFGTKRVARVNVERPDTDMHRIHLDCYFAPFGEKYCLLWEELIRVNTPHQRTVVEYVMQENGLYKRSEEEIPLFQYLIKKGFNVIPISTKSQEKYGCNILELNDGTVLTQDEESTKKIKNSMYVPFNEIHKMYGGIHCVTNMINSKGLL